MGCCYTKTAALKGNDLGVALTDIQPKLGTNDALSEPEPLGRASQILDENLATHLAAMFEMTVPGTGGAVNVSKIFQTCEIDCNTAFKRAATGHSNLLIIIQTSNNHVFGGFLAGPTYNPTLNKWVPADSATFLFSLSGVPFKLLHSGQDKGALFQNGAFVLGVGPDLITLGVSTGQYSCKPGNYTTFAPGYESIPLLDGTLCGTPGNHRYSPKRIEIYVVS